VAFFPPGVVGVVIVFTQQGKGCKPVYPPQVADANVVERYRLLPRRQEAMILNFCNQLHEYLRTAQSNLDQLSRAKRQNKDPTLNDEFKRRFERADIYRPSKLHICQAENKRPFATVAYG
jgi:hypothetical protein